jgi:hypothetical protein
MDGAPAFLLEWGTSGTGAGEFQTPRDVAAHPAGFVYVSDYDLDRIQKFSSEGDYLGQWGTTGTGGRQFIQPMGVAVDSAGSVYVADRNNHRVQKFTSGTVFLRTWGAGVLTGGAAFEICTVQADCKAGVAGYGLAVLSYPSGLAIDKEDKIYVASPGNGRVIKYTGAGNYVAHYGSDGAAEGQFITGPIGVAVDTDGFFITTDVSAYRVQVFNPDGDFVRMWGFGVRDGSNEYQVCTSSCQQGLGGTGDGQFFVPTDVAVDSNNDIYVMDAGNGRVQKFDRQGRLLAIWSEGNGPFGNPYGIAIEGSHLYVADAGRDAILKFVGPFLGTFVGEAAQERELRACAKVASSR